MSGSPPRRPAEAAGVLVAVSVGLGLATLNSTIVNVALPEIGRRLHMGLVLLQWVVNAFTLVYAGLLLPAGPLGDRIGRRRLLMTGMSVFAAGSVVCGAAPDAAVLLAGRVVQGVGGSAIVPAGLAILARQIEEPRARARALGVWAGVASLGLAVGPVLGGVLISRTGWRSVFWLVCALAVVGVAMVARLVPVTLHGGSAEPAPFDLAGAVLGGGWLAALSFALIEAHEYGWTSPVVLGAVAAAAAALGAFLGTERRRGVDGRPQIMPLAVWRSRPFVAANLGGLVYFLALFGILFFFSLYLQLVRGDSPLATGLLFLPLTVVMAAMGPVAGRMVAGVGVRPVVTAGLTLAGAGCFSLAALPPGAGRSGLEWRLVLTGVGFGLMSTPMTTAAMGSLARTAGGLASSLYNSSRQTGAVMGVALLGAVLTGRQTAVLRSSRGTTAPGPAFLSGLHAAMATSGVLLLACAATSWVLLGGRQRGAGTDGAAS